MTNGDGLLGFFHHHNTSSYLFGDLGGCVWWQGLLLVCCCFSSIEESESLMYLFCLGLLGDSDGQAEIWCLNCKVVAKHCYVIEKTCNSPWNSRHPTEAKSCQQGDSKNSFPRHSVFTTQCQLVLHVLQVSGKQHARIRPAGAKFSSALCSLLHSKDAEKQLKLPSAKSVTSCNAPNMGNLEKRVHITESNLSPT